MSAAPQTDLSVRDLALRAFAESNSIVSRIRKDESKKILFARLASDRFGLGSFRFDCTEVGFLEDDRAYIDIDGIRFAAPTESHIAGLYVIDGDVTHSITNLVDLGRLLKEENL